MKTFTHNRNSVLNFSVGQRWKHIPESGTDQFVITDLKECEECFCHKKCTSHHRIEITRDIGRFGGTSTFCLSDSEVALVNRAYEEV